MSSSFVSNQMVGDMHRYFETGLLVSVSFEVGQMTVRSYNASQGVLREYFLTDECLINQSPGDITELTGSPGLHVLVERISGMKHPTGQTFHAPGKEISSCKRGKGM